MAHVRKRIRRVLDDMGFDNQFHICDKSMSDYHKGESLMVTIRDWEPHPNAIELKKKLQCCADGCMEVEFELNAQPARRRTWKPGLTRH